MILVFPAGASLYEILAAGEWRSAAFLNYMDRAMLESGLLDQAHLGDCLDSDEEEQLMSPQVDEN